MIASIFVILGENMHDRAISSFKAGTKEKIFPLTQGALYWYQANALLHQRQGLTILLLRADTGSNHHESCILFNSTSQIHLSSQHTCNVSHVLLLVFNIIRIFSAGLITYGHNRSLKRNDQRSWFKRDSRFLHGRSRLHF